MACDTGRVAAQSSAESVAQAGASSKQLTYSETRSNNTASERSSKLADAVHLEITADCFAQYLYSLLCTVNAMFHTSFKCYSHLIQMLFSFKCYSLYCGTSHSQSKIMHRRVYRGYIC